MSIICPPEYKITGGHWTLSAYIFSKMADQNIKQDTFKYTNGQSNSHRHDKMADQFRYSILYSAGTLPIGGREGGGGDEGVVRVRGVQRERSRSHSGSGKAEGGAGGGGGGRGEVVMVVMVVMVWMVGVVPSTTTARPQGNLGEHGGEGEGEGEGGSVLGGGGGGEGEEVRGAELGDEGEGEGLDLL